MYVSNPHPQAGNPQMVETVISTQTLPFPQVQRGAPLSTPPTPAPQIDTRSLEVAVDPAPKSTLQPLSLTHELTPSERDAGVYALALPSNFLFYQFKELYASMVTAKQQSRFTRAAREGSLRLTIDTVSTCLNGVSAYDLTVPDFFYVMYWLRLASYTSFDFHHVSVCNNPEHLAAVQSGKKERDTLKTITTIKQTNLKETVLEKLPVVPQVVQDSGLQVQVQRMRDVADVEAYLESLPEDQREDQQMLALLACYIHPTQHNPRWGAGEQPMTFAERVQIAETLPVDLVRALQNEWEEAANSYGVEESITVKCKDCGANVRTEIRIAAPDFL